MEGTSKIETKIESLKFKKNRKNRQAIYKKSISRMMR